MAKVWIDLLNPSDVHFFAPLARALEAEHRVELTVRRRAETAALARMKGLACREVGTDSTNGAAKVALFAARTARLGLATSFDVAMGFENPATSFLARLRRKPSLQFLDNDLKLKQDVAGQSADTRAKLRSDYIVVPEAFDRVALAKHLKQGPRVVTFPGYKEDIYLAGFQPDPAFLDRLPFRDYVVLRPEALGSFYVEEHASIVPRILEALAKTDVRVVYLPRDAGDRKLAERFDVHVPATALDGLNLAWHARAVATGSGTFAREAARMGVPALSFFPGRLLSVDARLVADGAMTHTRDPQKAARFLAQSWTRAPRPSTDASREVGAAFQKTVLDLVKGVRA